MENRMLSRSVVASFSLVVLLSFFASANAQTASWIWHPQTNLPTAGEQVVYFRKTFRTPPLLWISRLTVAADDSADVYLNGVQVGRCESFEQPIRTEVTVRLNQGEN